MTSIYAPVVVSSFGFPDSKDVRESPVGLDPLPLSENADLGLKLFGELSPKQAGRVAGFIAHIISYRTGGAVSFETVVQALFALYAKIRMISSLQERALAFEEFSKSAQAADASLRSTQLSSGLSIGFASFGVLLGGFYLGKGAGSWAKDRISSSTGAKSGATGAAVGFADGRKDHNQQGLSDLPEAAQRGLLGGDLGKSPISSRRSSMDGHAEASRSSKNRQEALSTGDSKAAGTGEKAAIHRQSEKKELAKHDAANQAVKNSQDTPHASRGGQGNFDKLKGGLAGYGSERGKRLSKEEMLQIINGVIMYLFPTLGQSVGSLAGAADTHASDLLKGVSEQFALLRSNAEKSQDAATQGFSSIAQAWQQSPN